jgi:hypothetical protein
LPRNRYEHEEIISGRISESWKRDAEDHQDLMAKKFVLAVLGKID